MKQIAILNMFILMLASCDNKQNQAEIPNEMMDGRSSIEKSSEEQIIEPLREFFERPMLDSSVMTNDITMLEALQIYGEPNSKTEEVIKTKNTANGSMKIVFEYHDSRITWAIVNEGKTEICVARVIKSSIRYKLKYLDFGVGKEKIEELFGYPKSFDENQVVYEIDNVEYGTIAFLLKDNQLHQIDLNRNIE